MTPVGQIHLTLHFIGPTRPQELDHVRESLQRACSGISSFDMHSRHVILLPQAGSRVRVGAVLTDADPALIELQQRIAHRFARPARANTGDRFTPHLSIVRFAGAGVQRAAIEAGLMPFRPPEFRFRVRGMALMRSILAPQSAAHHELAVFDLDQ